MLKLRITRIAVAFTVGVFCCVAQTACSDDDPDIFIHSTSKQGSSTKLVWAVKRSRLTAIPIWHETVSEAPVSPHRAITAAMEFVQSRLGPSAHLRVVIITLFQEGIELNAVVPDLWAYTVSIECDPEPNDEDKELLNVMVLMDGKVVVPVHQPAR